MGLNDDLVRNLMAEGIIRSRGVEAAMLSVDRSYFVPGKLRRESYFDHPLQIGEGNLWDPPCRARMLDTFQGDSELETLTG